MNEIERIIDELETKANQWWEESQKPQYTDEQTYKEGYATGLDYAAAVLRQAVKNG